MARSAFRWCMQAYVADELIHFVGRSKKLDDERYDLLVSILRGGELMDIRYRDQRDSPIFYFDVVEKATGKARRRPYYPEPYFEVRQDGPVAANEFVAPEMVCFCDIPLRDLAIHTTKYSRFGIAFPKPFLVKQGANPVMYVAATAATPLQLTASSGEFVDFFSNEGEDSLLSPDQGRGLFLEKLKRRMFEVLDQHAEQLQVEFDRYERGKHDPGALRQQMLSSVEFMMGTFCYLFGYLKTYDPSLPEDHPNNFYMEREWRVVGRVRFDLHDVVRIVVPAAYAERLRTDLPSFAGDLYTL